MRPLNTFYPGDRVLIQAEVVELSADGTMTMRSGRTPWSVASGWLAEPDPEYTVTLGELNLARDNWEGLCRMFGIDYDLLQRAARRNFRRSLTRGGGFAAYISKIVLYRVQEARTK